MRKILVETDVVECIIGLGKNLFYNSPMEACIVICRMNKPLERKSKVLFINAVDEVTRERAQSFLDVEHIQKIAGVYHSFEVKEEFSYVATVEEIQKNNNSLSIPLYVRHGNVGGDELTELQLEDCLDAWLQSSMELHDSMKKLFELLSSTPPDGGPDKGNSDTSFVEEEAKPKNNIEEQHQLVQPAYLRALLAAEIVYQNYQEQRFGAVKLEKLIFPL